MQPLRTCLTFGQEELILALYDPEAPDVLDEHFFRIALRGPGINLEIDVAFFDDIFFLLKTALFEGPRVVQVSSMNHEIELRFEVVQVQPFESAVEVQLRFQPEGWSGRLEFRKNYAWRDIEAY
ncbi:MAG TPA: hypothetical protein PKY51_12290 [Fimbriimonadaceae bacterium]|nr:hypothetical protein [Fimbriimonadaceae bacterium]